VDRMPLVAQQDLRADPRESKEGADEYRPDEEQSDGFPTARTRRRLSRDCRSFGVLPGESVGAIGRSGGGGDIKSRLMDRRAQSSETITAFVRLAPLLLIVFGSMIAPCSVMTVPGGRLATSPTGRSRYTAGARSGSGNGLPSK